MDDKRRVQGDQRNRQGKDEKVKNVQGMKEGEVRKGVDADIYYTKKIE